MQVWNSSETTDALRASDNQANGLISIRYEPIKEVAHGS